MVRPARRATAPSMSLVRCRWWHRRLRAPSPREQPLSCSSHRGGGSGPGAVSGAAADALPSASARVAAATALPPKGVARGLPNAPTHRASYTPRGAQSLPASPRSADEPEGRLNDVLAATAALRTGAGALSRDHPLKRIVVERLLTVDSRAERAVHAAVKAPLKGAFDVLDVVAFWHASVYRRALGVQNRLAMWAIVRLNLY